MSSVGSVIILVLSLCYFILNYETNLRNPLIFLLQIFNCNCTAFHMFHVHYFYIIIANNLSDKEMENIGVLIIILIF